MAKRVLLAVSAVCVLCWSGPVNAQNSVVVESKTVFTNVTGMTLGVYVTNDQILSAMGLPLEFREIDEGCFPATTLGLTIQGRVAASGLMDFANLRVFGAPEEANTCSGPLSHTYALDSPVDFVSPDALWWQGLAITGPLLAPGSDGSPPSGIPSFVFTFDVAGTPGLFEIDTCCVAPFNKLYFDGPTAVWVVGFTKGLITVECVCLCHADPVCDSVKSDIFDVTAAVDVAFRESAPFFDPGCPAARTDVDCDAIINVLDVVRIVNVAFRNANAEEEYCHPCAPA